mmetsp:Transcript_39114/g.94159  ORF Transcript_39114/g.94159 Transcript_39114/m.94159 type:complete len:122 (+) Transcript_39114:205-570(+)
MKLHSTVSTAIVRTIPLEGLLSWSTVELASRPVSAINKASPKSRKGMVGLVSVGDALAVGLSDTVGNIVDVGESLGLNDGAKDGLLEGDVDVDGDCEGVFEGRLDGSEDGWPEGWEDSDGW